MSCEGDEATPFNPWRLMESMGYIHGQGLGKNNEGIVEAVEVERRGREGLRGPSEVPCLESDLSKTKQITKTKDQIRMLHKALNSIDTTDAAHFYYEFSGLECWQELELWRLVYAQVSKNIDTDPLGVDFEIAFECLPRNFYLQLLRRWGASVDKLDKLKITEFATKNKHLLAPIWHEFQNINPTFFDSKKWLNDIRRAAPHISADELAACIWELKNCGGDTRVLGPALDAVNAHLDTGRVPEHSFSELVSTYCRLNGLTNLAGDDQSGTINGDTKWYVVGDELFTASNGKGQPWDISHSIR